MKKILKCSCGCGKEQVEKVGGNEVMAFGCKESIARSEQEFKVKYGLISSKEDCNMNPYETVRLENGDYILKKDGLTIAIINKKAIAKLELPKEEKPN